MGVAFEEATKGPFAQFQNSPDDEDSLTKLVHQLIKRNSDAEPREEAIRKQVKAFRELVAEAPSFVSQGAAKTPAETEASDAAKLFEEIKLMFRELPQILDNRLLVSLHSRDRRSRINGRVLSGIMREIQDANAAWLMGISCVREGAPWAYEFGLEFYKALKTGNTQRIRQAHDQFVESIDSALSSEVGRYLLDNSEMQSAIRQLQQAAHEIAEYSMLKVSVVNTRPRRRASLTEQVSSEETTRNSGLP